jgi:hypothetical protein
MPNSQSTVSPEQLAANRANAAKSTGPRSPEGKTRSARNARKHGFTASTFAVVSLEGLNEVADLKDDLVAFYQPVNSQELFAVERIALAQQALLRVARLEAGLFTACLNEVLDLRDGPMIVTDPDLVCEIEVTRPQNRNFLLGEGFWRSVGKSNAWTLFLRYQAQTERLYRRAVEEFDRLKALPAEIPIKPISEPERHEPTCTLDETNPIPPEQPQSKGFAHTAAPEPELNPAGCPDALESRGESPEFQRRHPSTAPRPADSEPRYPRRESGSAHGGAFSR